MFSRSIKASSGAKGCLYTDFMQAVAVRRMNDDRGLQFLTALRRRAPQLREIDLRFNLLGDTSAVRA